MLGHVRRQNEIDNLPSQLSVGPCGEALKSAEKHKFLP